MIYVSNERSTQRDWRSAYSEAGRNSSGSVDKTAQRVRTPTAYLKNTISAEAVSLAAGAAGTTGIVSLERSAIYDSKGADIGRTGDTSFAWVTGTILTTEVVYRTDLSDTEQFALMANGEFALNYDTGRIRYRKATAGTSDTCNYTTRKLEVEAELEVGDIEIGAVELKDGTTDNRGIINAANTARTTATNVLCVQVIDENGYVVGGSTGPQAPQTLGTLASGTDAYQTVLTTVGAASHIKISLTGANDAIVSVNGGTTDHIRVQANSEVVLDDVLIAATTAIRAKNFTGGSNHSSMSITVW